MSLSIGQILKELADLEKNIDAEAQRTKRNVQKALHLAVNRVIKDQHERNVLNNALDVVINAEVDKIEAELTHFLDQL